MIGRYSLATAIIMLLTSSAPAALSLGNRFTRDNFYATCYWSSTINEYDPYGNLVGSLSPPGLGGKDLRGVAFGPDNLLYVVASQDSGGYSVYAMDALGSVQQTYQGSWSIRTGLYMGKIAFDQNNHFYVTSPSGIQQFTLGNPSSGGEPLHGQLQRRRSAA